MGFWIFMTGINLLIPLIMVGFGTYFFKNVPKKINHIFGYRTTMSMKNRDTWEFAHHYCGRIWRMVGWMLLPVSILAMLVVLGKDVDTVGLFGGIVCVVQAGILILSIFPTERALKQTFEESGRRRE